MVKSNDPGRVNGGKGHGVVDRLDYSSAVWGRESCLSVPGRWLHATTSSSSTWTDIYRQQGRLVYS